MHNAFVAIKSFGERFLPVDAFNELCSTPQGIQGVYRMMQSMEPDVLTNKNSVSKSYLSRFFKSSFGIGINRYISTIRLKNAIELMHEKSTALHTVL